MMRHMGNLRFSVPAFGDILVGRHSAAIEHPLRDYGYATAIIELAVKCAPLSVIAANNRSPQDPLKRLIR
jgi:hypothetical protein